MIHKEARLRNRCHFRIDNINNFKMFFHSYINTICKQFANGAAIPIIIPWHFPTSRPSQTEQSRLWFSYWGTFKLLVYTYLQRCTTCRSFSFLFSHHMGHRHSLSNQTRPLSIWRKLTQLTYRNFWVKSSRPIEWEKGDNRRAFVWGGSELESFLPEAMSHSYISVTLLT